MSLSHIRNRIDQIDDQLLTLFLQRMECSRQVAEIKMQQNLPILNAAREEEILSDLSQKAGPFADKVRALYATIFDLSRAYQQELMGKGEALSSLIAGAEHLALPENARVACQGVAGAYSQQAAAQLFPGCEPAFFEAWEDVFSALAEDRADFGVLPVENSSAGSVSEVYDLILKYRYFITGAVNLTVDHCLAAKSGTKEEDIRRVFSHPQALAQCSGLIAARGYTAVPCANTAVAAQAVAAQGGDAAALCSPAAAELAGLTVVRRAVQNSKLNHTRFAVISRKLLIPENADKISLCFSLPHTTGSLYRILARFAAQGLNLTKIESRPIAGRAFEYLFYLDFSGSVYRKETERLLCLLSEELPGFSFLGNYRESFA